MHKKITTAFRLFTIGVLSLVLLACTKPAYEAAGIELPEDISPKVKQLALLMELSPEDRAELFFAEGHTQLLAYNSLEGTKVPGLSKHQSEPWLTKFSVELAPAMGDEIYSESRRKLQAFYLDYAASYNQAMFEAVKNQK